MKRYPMIDAAKLFCALLIVFMHALYYLENHYWAHMVVASLCYQAVPFFLIVSGFFFTRNLERAEDKRKYVLGYVKKLLTYYVLWILILSPETIGVYMEKYPDSSWWYRAALIARRVIFSGNGVYWYLLVLAESAVIVSILLSRGHEKLLYALGGIGLILGFVYDANFSALGLDRIRNVFYTIFAWSNNFLMKGVPYMAIGCFFARNLSKWSLRTKPLMLCYMAVAVVNVVIFCLLYRWTGKPEKYMWLYPIQAMLLFLCCIASDTTFLPKKLVQEVRPLSSAIYCVHCFFLNYVVNPLVTTDANTFLRFLLGAALSIGFYWIIKKVGSKPLYRLLTLS